MGKGGQQAETPSPGSLREDPRFQAFFQEGFNPADFASQALAGAPSYITASTMVSLLPPCGSLVVFDSSSACRKKFDSAMRSLPCLHMSPDPGAAPVVGGLL